MTKKSIRIRTSITSGLIALALLSLMPARAHAEESKSVVPDGINYQGLLTDALGEPVKPDGEYTLEFRLWSDPSSEDASKELVWGRAFKVIVVNGQFNVILNDAGTALAEAAEHRVKSIMDAFAGPERYLGIKITSAPITNPEGETEGEATVKAATVTGEIKPRQAILSTPYALEAGNGVPVGTIVSFFGTTIPEGWLLCDGKTDLTSDPKYADLRTVTGSDMVPDLQGYFIRGLGGPSSNMNIEQSYGTGLPKTPFVIGGGAHKHAISGWANDCFGGQPRTTMHTLAGNQDVTYTKTDGKHTHTLTGGDKETRPKNKAFNYIIKY